MMERDYENVPGVDRTDIHDRDALLVPINHTRLDRDARRLVVKHKAVQRA
jgi:hypothetical protein